MGETATTPQLNSSPSWDWLASDLPEQLQLPAQSESENPSPHSPQDLAQALALARQGSSETLQHPLFAPDDSNESGSARSLAANLREQFAENLAAFQSNMHQDPELALEHFQILSETAQYLRGAGISSDRQVLTQDLIQLRCFYQAAMAFATSQRFRGLEPNEDLNTDILHESLQGVEQGLGTLREFLRSNAREEGQLNSARLAAQISLELGHFAGLTMDLRIWEGALPGLDLSDSRNEQVYLRNGVALLRAWTAVRHAHSQETGESDAPPIPFTDAQIETKQREWAETIVEILSGRGEISQESFELFSARLHGAINEVDASFLTQLTPSGIEGYFTHLQYAQVLGEESSNAEAGAGLLRRLQAASLYGSLGQSEEARELLIQAEGDLTQLPTQAERIEGLWQLAQLYQGAGLTEDTVRILSQVEEAAENSSDPGHQELSLRARALTQIQNGEITEAQETLSQIAEAPGVAELQEGLEEGQRVQREERVYAVWQLALNGYLEQLRSEENPDVAEIEAELTAALAEAHGRVLRGECDNLDQAMGALESGRVQHYLYSDHTQAHQLHGLSNLNLNEADFSQAVMDAAQGFLRAERYNTAAGLAHVLRDNEHVGSEARELIAELPDTMAWDSILTSLGNMSIIFAEDAGDAVIYAGITLATFGVAEFLAVEAEVAYGLWSLRTGFAAAGRMGLDSAIRSGIYMGTSSAVLTSSELIQMGCEGQGEYITPGLVLRSFAANMVMFGLLRGTGSVMGRMSRPVEQRLAQAEAVAATARRTGVGVERATQRLGRARTAARGMMLARWGSRVGALTATEYANEGLGLRESSGSSLGMRLLHSAVIDAQMMIAARAVNAASGGRMERRRRDLHQRYAEHAVELAQPDIAKILANLEVNGLIDTADPMALYLRSALEASVAQTGQTRVAEVLASSRGRRALFRAMDGLGLEPGSRAYDMAANSILMNALTQSSSRGGLLRNMRHQGERLQGQRELLQGLARQMAEAASGMECREFSESELAALQDRMLGQLINRALVTEWSNGEMQEISEGMAEGRISLFVTLDFATGEFLWDFRQSPIEIPSVEEAPTALAENNGGVARESQASALLEASPPSEAAPEAEIIPLNPSSSNPNPIQTGTWARRAAAMVGLGVGMEALFHPSEAWAAVENIRSVSEGFDPHMSSGTFIGMGLLGAGLLGSIFFPKGNGEDSGQVDLNFSEAAPETPPSPYQEYLIQLGRVGLPRTHGAILDALAHYGPMSTPVLSRRVNSHHPTGEVLSELGRLADLGLVSSSSDGSGTFELTSRGRELRQVMSHFGLHMVVSPQGRAILHVLGQRRFLTHGGLLRDLGEAVGPELESELSFLERRGLLHITRDPVDAQRTRYRLTQDGRDTAYHLRRQLEQLETLLQGSREEGGSSSGGSSALSLLAGLSTSAGILLSTQVAEAAGSVTGSGNVADITPLLAGGALSLGALAMASSSNDSGDGSASGPFGWFRQKWHELRQGASSEPSPVEPGQEPPEDRGGGGGPYRDLPGSHLGMQERIEAALDLAERISEGRSVNLQVIREGFPELGEEGQNVVLEAMIPHLRLQNRQTDVLYLFNYLQTHLNGSQKIRLGQSLIDSIQRWEVREYSIPIIRFLETLGSQNNSSRVMAEIQTQFEARTKIPWAEALHHAHLIQILPQLLHQVLRGGPTAQREGLRNLESMLPLVPSYVRGPVIYDIFQWAMGPNHSDVILEPWARFRHRFYEDYTQVVQPNFDNAVAFNLFEGPYKIFFMAEGAPGGRLDPLLALPESASSPTGSNGPSTLRDSENTPEGTNASSEDSAATAPTPPPPPGGVFPLSGGIAQLYPFAMQDHPNLAQAQTVLATSVQKQIPRMVSFDAGSDWIIDPPSLSLRFAHGRIRNGHGHWGNELRILASDAEALGLVVQDAQGHYQLTENPWFLIYDHQNPSPPENGGGSASGNSGLFAGLMAFAAGGSSLFLPEVAQGATEGALATGGDGGILAMVGAMLGVGALAMARSPYRDPAPQNTPSEILAQIEHITAALPQIQSIGDLTPNGVRQVLHRFIYSQVPTGSRGGETQPISGALRQLHEAIRHFNGSGEELVAISRAFREISFPILMIPAKPPMVSESETPEEVPENDTYTSRSTPERFPLTDFYPLENQRRVRDILDQVARDPAWKRHMVDLPLNEIHSALLSALNAYPIANLEQLGETLMTLARLRDRFPEGHPERVHVERMIQEMQAIAEEWGVNDPRANALGALSGLGAGAMVAGIAGGMGPLVGVLMALGMPLSSAMSVNGAILTRNIMRFGWVAALNDLYEQLVPFRYPHHWINLPRHLLQGTWLLMDELHESLAERFPDTQAVRLLGRILSLRHFLLPRLGRREVDPEESFSISAAELFQWGGEAVPRESPEATQVEEAEVDSAQTPLQVRVDPDLGDPLEEVAEEEFELDLSDLQASEREIEE